jgi:hypothetical protein
MDDNQSFAEKYAMRSVFYRLLGEAGKTLADAYTQADAENQVAIKDLIAAALVDSLVEHHGYRRDELSALVAA